MNNDRMPVLDPAHEPSASYMLDHFLCVGVSNITSEFVVVVLLPWLLFAAQLKKNDCAKKWNTLL